MSGAPEAVGTLDIALGRAAQLLASDPALAIEQANEILKVVPGHAAATLILGAANRAAGKLTMALAVLEPLSRAHPAWAGAHYERALALGLVGERDRAIAALRRAVELKPDHGDAWRALGDLLVTGGDPGNAFTLNPTTGVITVRDPSQIDFSTNPLYVLNVQVTLSDGTIGTFNVTINVKNVFGPNSPR